MKKFIYILFTILLFTSCSDYKYIDDNVFTGVWELKGRTLYSGMTIKIEKTNNSYIGKVIHPPNNKYGKMFIEKNDKWITDIKRAADYYFKITESKIAGEIFTMYNLPINQEYNVTFNKDKTKFYLSKDTPHKIKETAIYYERVIEYKKGLDN